MTLMEPVTKIGSLAFISFLAAMLLTPVLTHFLYKYKVGKQVRADKQVFSTLHAGKAGTPTMGGLLIWVTAAIVTVILNLSREQTYLPLFALVTVGVLGLVDDILNTKGVGKNKGLRVGQKLLWQLLIAGVGAWWFFYKLGFSSIHLPILGDFAIGFWYIPLFIFIIIAAANAVNITDGLDGLAGGTSALAYLAFGVIAFAQGQYGIAAFCGTVAGATLAFLWFNIYPARFFMGDTGSMALGATLGVIAMLTNSVVVLPIVGFIFVMEVLSVIIQLTYRKLSGGKKLFRSAPIHHHFEAKGWPETKVTMRFWVIGAVMAVIGVVIALLEK